LLACIVVLAVALTLHHSSRSGPGLATSCTTPAIALSSAATNGGNGISYSITGPQTGTYVVAVDAATVSVKGDGVIATPKGAFGASIRQGLKGCSASGTLPTLAAGPHAVVLFRDGQEVARASLHG
jgi:hypothetical protein